MINIEEIKGDPERIANFLKSEQFLNLPHYVKTVVLIQLGVIDPNNN